MILIPILILIALAAWLTRYFVGHDRGEREPVRALWAVFWFGLLGAIMAAFLETLIPAKYLSADHQVPVSLGLFLAALAVGVIEELCKFLPAALYLYRKRYFNEHTDGIIYFAIAGLGFGLPENILYVLSFGAAAGYARVIFTPFFHAAMTGLIGYFLVRTKIDAQPKWRVAAAFTAAAVLHGLYDFGLLSHIVVFVVLSLAITFSMTAVLFILYKRSTQADQAQGLSVVGVNNFCRSCGFPNPSHQLYCQQCGKRA